MLRKLLERLVIVGPNTLTGRLYMEQTMTEHVLSYLSRLTGEKLGVDTPLRLRSVQRAAFASWAHNQQVSVRLSVISSSVPFSIRELLTVQGEAPPSPAAQEKTPIVAAPSTAAVSQAIGIDIEEVENLPAAGDYREHGFYQDNFTSAEIAFCIRQPHVRASFCGTWAAKEAILKAGHASAPAGNLKGIEILRDDQGRPSHPGCSLSISHTARMAVAICSAP